VYRFRPRLLPTLGVVAGVVFLGNLGAWQLRRRAEAAEERVRYAERLAEPAFDVFTPPADADLRRARVSGVPDWDHHVLLAGKYMWGQIGYQLVVPVHGAGGVVMVDVGWVPADEVEPIVARERGEPSPRAYEGLLRAEPEVPDAAGTFAPEGGYQRRWRAMSPRAMAQGADVPAYVLFDGEGISGDADIPDRVPPIGGWRTEPVQRPHGEYAFTWFSLMTTLILVWGSASFRRDAPEPSAPP
jgi:cytochrome oxidase assembly protein ShyY1